MVHKKYSLPVYLGFEVMVWYVFGTVGEKSKNKILYFTIELLPSHSITHCLYIENVCTGASSLSLKFKAFCQNKPLCKMEI